MLRRAEGSLGGSHAGELHRQAAEAKAQRIIGTSKSANGKLHEFMKGGGQNDPPGHSQDTFKLEAHEAK